LYKNVKKSLRISNMTIKKTAAVAYFRTSSASNDGPDKDSQRRQTAAVGAYARGRAQLTIMGTFYDAAVSGADPVGGRRGFSELLSYCAEHSVAVALVENASRFARDLAVQITGHELLKVRGIELVPVDAPTYFSDPSSTAKLVRQLLEAVSEFEKDGTVAKLKAARDRKRMETGRCEGRPAVPREVVAVAKRLARRSPKTGKARSLRAIAAELAAMGHLGVSGGPYTASSVRHMLQA
jgi:DNA invertase Pin-like site-specific DNA recombinase